MTDEWASEDLPVLHAVRELEAERPAGEFFRAREVQQRLDLETRRTLQLLDRLMQSGYIDGKPLRSAQALHDVSVYGLTERGRRAVGQWPSEDPWTGLIDVLQQQIDAEPDEDKRTRLVRFRDGVLAAGRTVGVSMLTKFAEQQAGLS